MPNQCAVYIKSGDYGPDYIYRIDQFANYAKKGTEKIPFTFNAQEYNITCVAFADATGFTSFVELGAAVYQAQAAIANLQTQVTALTSGSTVRAPNPEILQASSVLFGSVLLAGALIWGLKRVYLAFHHTPEN